jgi:hypothetical protein
VRKRALTSVATTAYLDSTAFDLILMCPCTCCGINSVSPPGVRVGMFFIVQCAACVCVCVWLCVGQVVKLTNLIDGGEDATRRRRYILAPQLRTEAIDKPNMTRYGTRHPTLW